MQYTIRNIPDHLDAALREIARSRGTSLNGTVILALEHGIGLLRSPRRRDLADIAGTWQEDPAFDDAISAQDTTEASIWQGCKTCS